MQTFGFKCSNCGHLEAAEAAGENTLPSACSTCGHGVKFDPVTGIRSFEPENWVVLADLSDSEITGMGLTAKQVKKHKPFAPGDVSRTALHVVRDAEESMGAEDKA